MPFQIDRPATVRSMALRFLPPNGEEWRTGMNNIPVFPVNSARAFTEQLLASAPDPATGKPDPAKMRAFLAAHPEVARALAVLAKRQVSSGFADATFNSLNAFRFVNAAGVSVPVRWSTVPVQPFTPAGPAVETDKNALFDDLLHQVAQHPLQWHLMVTIGAPGDPTNDATQPWPADRQQIDAGTVTIDHAESEDSGPCTWTNYDPTVLPSGIEASDDPLLSARSAAYARSLHPARPGACRKAAQCRLAQRSPRRRSVMRDRFSIASRSLHWLMAIMIVAMLFIGVGMAASVSTRYALLLSIHRPLGIAILLLVVVAWRTAGSTRHPTCPPPCRRVQRLAAHASHIVLYALMFAMPLIGWGMLSAERVPIVLFGPLRLPPILPQNLALYAWLRPLHTDLGYLLFATVLVHLGAALLHGLIRRDGVFESMAPIPLRRN